MVVTAERFRDAFAVLCLLEPEYLAKMLSMVSDSAWGHFGSTVVGLGTEPLEDTLMLLATVNNECPKKLLDRASREAWQKFTQLAAGAPISHFPKLQRISNTIGVGKKKWKEWLS